MGEVVYMFEVLFLIRVFKRREYIHVLYHTSPKLHINQEVKRNFSDFLSQDITNTGGTTFV